MTIETNASSGFSIDEAAMATPAKHTFLDYERVSCNFIYSFKWRGNLDTALFTSLATRELTSKPNGLVWSTPLLHERLLSTADGDCEGYNNAYQPSFVTRRRVIEATGSNAAHARVLVPLTAKATLSSGLPELASVPVRVRWTTRFFDTYVGTVNVAVSSPDLRALSRHLRYAVVHWLLHLSPNVDRYTESHPHAQRDTSAPPIDSFVSFAQGLFMSTDAETPMRLHELASRVVHEAVAQVPVEFNDAKQPVGLADEHLFQPNDSRELSTSEPYHNLRWNESQAPFIVTHCRISTSAVDELRQVWSEDRSKEITAILTKLTMANKQVACDFTRLGTDYLHEFLLTSRQDSSLSNFCLDERMFFTMSRRGALCFSCEAEPGPSSFVVPSFINLCELLRARLHAAVALNWELMDIARRVAGETGPDGLSQQFLRDYARVRKFYVLNINNPVVHLFDGGSITEVAAKADELLFLQKTWDDVARTFEAVDRLVSTTAAAALEMDL